MAPPENMTTEEALRKGFWMIRAPSTFLMISPLLANVALAEFGYIPHFGYEGMKLFLLMFLGGFSFGWLVWSIQVPRWKLLVYPHVKNLADLKKRAVVEKLIWPTGHLLEKTEMASSRVRERIREVEAIQETKNNA